VYATQVCAGVSNIGLLWLAHIKLLTSLLLLLLLLLLHSCCVFHPNRYCDIARLRLESGGHVLNDDAQQQLVMMAGLEGMTAAAAAAAGGDNADELMLQAGYMVDGHYQDTCVFGAYYGNESSDAYAPVDRLAAAAAAAAEDHDDEVAAAEAAAAGASALPQQPAKQRGDDLAAYRKYAMNLANELEQLQKLVSG
jgi:hypothetical protein